MLLEFSKKLRSMLNQDLPKMPDMMTCVMGSLTGTGMCQTTTFPGSLRFLREEPASYIAISAAHMHTNTSTADR